MNRHERRAQKKQNGSPVASAGVELSCSCGWPLPAVWLAFDRTKPMPSYDAARELLQGAAIRVDCPMCGRTHNEPLTEEEKGGEGAQGAPIRAIRASLPISHLRAAA